MNGQWLGELQDDEPKASIRIDLEDRGHGSFGNAYLFYPNGNLPGFQFPINLPSAPPYVTTVNATYLYPWGGVMTIAERKADEERIRQMGWTPPSAINVRMHEEGETLRIAWNNHDGRSGTVCLKKADTSTVSAMKGCVDLKTWAHFRQWAISQSPKKYIFRGQRCPHKLVSSFHRTWRSDLHAWIMDDAERLYGAVADRLSFPLQIGNLQHNAAIWSILQHHGYPTPMIDWSLSPFVAAYFAFEAAEKNGSAPRIFIFDREAWGRRYDRKHIIVDAAPDQIVVLETMAAANPRHVPQQSLTTVTNVADVESFIRRKEIEDGVSYLTVCDLPAASRPQIMRELELMGITYGSLFPGLDGICRDMKSLLFDEPVASITRAKSNHDVAKSTLLRRLLSCLRPTR
ncbi:FRG domain-containing protein [Sphingomonas phyllosphaerae]|uniref:FRG domain-containing protein n=1 Tax=Sphingomonas phyllosphaerae TaxID=257003 RepID=UPI0003F6CB21|nr:FRG domain-containing protein [Sphingomonas phyllosphaerae]